MLKHSKDSISSVLIRDKSIYTGSIDGKIRHYDLRNGSLTTDDFFNPVVSLDTTQDQNQVIGSCLDNRIRLLDGMTGEILSEYAGHRTTKYSIGLKFLKGETSFVTGSEDGFVYVYKILQVRAFRRVFIAIASPSAQT